MRMSKYFMMMAGALLLVFSSCKKDDEEAGPKDLEIQFNYIDDNTVYFEHNNAVTGIPSWDFGNGETSDQNSATVVYPFAGTYSVKLSIFAEAGEVVDSVEVTIASSDPSLITLTPDEILLCGGAEAVNGKTWVWARYVPQHMMLGQWEPWQWWWGAAPNEKEPFNMYDDKMIFKAFNYEFILENNDSTYVNVNTLGDFDVEGDGDMTVYYDLSEKKFNWSLDERGDGTYLTLSNGGFMSYYLGANEFKVEDLSENEMTLSTIIDNAYWQFMFMTEGYDHPDAVDPTVNENLSPATSVDQLTDDFETAADILWLFQAEGGGGSGDDEASNPAAGGINSSATVYHYVKGTWEYSNASMELGFEIDLATHNRVSMKVYFPSSNTYSDTGLKQKASVKLQRWNESAPWDTQAEVILEGIATDEWTELIFDFSTLSIPAERMSGYFNKIVIQFGDEGHVEDGTFYFDDFEVLPAE